MSYSDNFYKALEEQKKKKKKTDNEIAPVSTGDSFSDNFYAELRKREKEVDALASSRAQDVVSFSRQEHEDDIAPVKGGNKDSVFKSGAFSDGVDGVGDFFEDLGQTILGTIGDLGVGITKGAGNLAEGVVDLGTYATAGVADLIGKDDFAKKAKDIAKKNFVNDLLDESQEWVDQYSVLGNTADSVSEGLGQVAGIILTGGLGEAAGLTSAGVSALTTGTLFSSSMGGGMSEAYQGGASDEDAVKYGATVGAIEAVSEMIFGGLGKGVQALGLSKGLTSIDDVFAKKLSNTAAKFITSKAGQNLVGNVLEYAVKSGAEGLEEVISGFGTAIAKDLFLLNGEDEKAFGEILKDENLLEQFVVGSIVSGISQGGDLISSTKSGRDFVSGLSQNEQSVVDKVFEERLAEESKTRKIGNTEKNKLYDQVVEEMKRGYIDTDTIERILGGKTYDGYKNLAEQETSLTDKKKAIEKEISSLVKTPESQFTVEQRERLNSLREEAKGIKEQIKGLDTKTAKTNLFNEVDKLTKNDIYLRESYNDLIRKTQDIQIDDTQYKGTKFEDAAKKTIENARKAGASNSNRVRDFVEFSAKYSSVSGAVVDFKDDKQIRGVLENQLKAEIATLQKSGADNTKLTELQDMLKQVQEGKIRVNGVKTKDGVAININSSNYLNTVLGHEVTHLLEGTGKAYEDLQKAAFRYAQLKGDYAGRRKILDVLYKNIDGTTVDSELTADLVGDYLFTEYDFIKDLSTNNRNVFQKIYDQIKYMFKLATAGSKEARELEKVMHNFEMALRESVATTQDSGKAAQGDAAQGEPDVDSEIKFSIRKEDPPKNTIKGYKVFKVVDGKLYPPMVENPSGNGTPVGVWLDADVGGLAYNKDGSVKLNTKGRFAVESSQGGSLAFRPGWHLGEYPDASQFGRMDTSRPLTEEELSTYEGKTYKDKNGNVYPMNLFPYNFVWAECEVAADHDYQLDAMALGVNEKGNFVRSQAGLPYVPTDGYYKYRTNADPNTAPWIISGAIKVNRILDDADVAEICAQHGVTPQTREGYTSLTKKDGGSRTPGNAINLSDFKLLRGDVTPTDANTLAEIAMSDGLARERSATAMDLLKTLPGYAKREINFSDENIIKEFGMNNQDVEYYRQLAESTKNGYLADDKLYSNADVKFSISKDSNGNPLSPAVQKRFEKSKAVDENGNLKVLYHGTASGEFFTFDKSKGSVEGDFGSGFYFTDNEYDAEDNYVGGGPDFSNKVARRAEQIEQEEGIDYAHAEDKAFNELYVGRKKFEVYLNIENPAIVGETYLLDYESFAEEYDRNDYDSDEDYESDVEQLIADEIDSIVWDIERNVDIYSTDGIADVLWNAVNEGGVGIEQLKARIAELYLEDNNGNIVGGEVVRQIIESLGYDGIIDSTVSSKFNMGLDEGTTHYIVFKPNQIKDISNQNPTDNPDIRYSLSKNSLDNEVDLVYNVNGDFRRGDGFVRTDEFRNLQAESQRMSVEELQGYHRGDRTLDESVRRRLSGVLSRQVGAVCGSNRNDSRLLRLGTENNTYNIYENVNGELFHDAFEISRQYLKNGELVDLHTVETTEDGIGYNDCYNYLSEDGLSGFSITPDGDLISVFNASGKNGFLRAISGIVKENAKTLDCYASPNQNLMAMYEKVFGFKTASVMDYNMEYDHDNIAENHNMPQVAFMVNTGSDVETKAFAKDQYDEAVAYRNGFVVSDDIAPTQHSLSNAGEQRRLGGSYRFDGKDFRVQQNQDIAPVAEGVAKNATDTNVGHTTADDTAEDAAPAQTVDEKISAKLKNLQTELDNNLRLRGESNADFDSEIARLRAEYEAKKNKNTKVANDVLRRIERIQRLKGNVDADYQKRITGLQERIQKMNTPQYKRGEQRRAKQEKWSNEIKELIGDTSTWVDKKLGISYQTNTLRRNLRDVVRDANGNRDIAKADAIYEYLQGSYNHNEALLKRESRDIKQPFADMDINKYESEYIQMLGEFKYNPETKLTLEAVDEYYGKHKDNIDLDKVNRAIDEARKVYDDLFKRVNAVLREMGLKEMGYKEGYFPHFTDTKQGWLAKLFNWKTIDTEIPTDIAGMTEEFNPVRTYQSFDKRRKSDETDYNFLKGFDTYVHGALDWIYHIEDIQKRRAFENEIRYSHSEQGIRDKVTEIINNKELDADEVQALLDNVYTEAKNPLNNFVTDLRNSTNNLAGKKSTADRSMEYATNRKVYSTMTNLSNRVSGNMVVGSISSALTNFIPITQSWGQVSPVSSLRAVGDVVRSAFRNDGMVEKSDFMTNRLLNEENLNQTGWDKASNVAGGLMNIFDHFTTEVVWRSKYIENMDSGMSESEAIHDADVFAENVMAGRSRGNMPTIYNSKNPITKMLTAFQLEVGNQYGYLFKDLPQDVGKESIGKLTAGYAKMFIGAYVYNALFSKLTGRDAAFDPIGIVEDLLKDLGFGGDDEEEEADILGAVQGLGENILQEVPYVGGLLGGGRIPISSALPYDSITKMVTGTMTDIAEKDWENLTNEWLNPVYYLALPFGGGQLKKTNEGLGMFSDDHPVSGSYTASGNLRFPVEDTPLNRVQAALFGQYASENAREYFDNDYAPLKEKQIQEYIDVDIPIKDYWEYREGLKKQETLEDKFDYIAGLDLPVEKKNILINNVVDRKDEVDLEGYEDFSSLEEFDFATEYPDKYAVAKAVGGYSSYKQYASDLYGIKADKDANGKTITGSRKEKVIQYINGLNADYETKIILYKSEYPSDDTYNADIINYVNNRADLTYEERVAILTELGFRVVNGNIYAD